MEVKERIQGLLVSKDVENEKVFASHESTS
jgi:hypothetical protein